MLCILCFNFTKIAPVKRGPLDSYYNILLYKFFCIDMPEDGLSTGLNM